MLLWSNDAWVSGPQEFFSQQGAVALTSTVFMAHPRDKESQDQSESLEQQSADQTLARLVKSVDTWRKATKPPLEWATQKSNILGEVLPVGKVWSHQFSNKDLQREWDVKVVFTKDLSTSQSKELLKVVEDIVNPLEQRSKK